MPAPAVIDLGVVGEHAPPSPPRAVPRPAARYRAAAAVLVAAVALTVLGASAPAAPPALHPVADIAIPPDHRPWSLGAADIAVLVTDHDRPGTVTLASYSLADGAPRWAAEADPAVTDLQRWPEGGMLFTVDGFGWTTAWDESTGARRWRARGLYFGTAAGRVLLGTGVDGPLTVHVTDPETGQEVWSFTEAGDVPAVFDEAGGSAEAARVVLVTADGTTTVRRVADGAELLRGRVDLGMPGTTYGVLLMHGLLYTVETVAGDSTVSAYRLDRLAPLWRRPFDGELDMAPCGQLLCLRDGGSLQALDARTGVHAWTNADWPSVTLVPPGRLVAESRGGGARHGLLDPATGRTVADLGDAVLGAGAAMLALRQDRADAGRTVVQRVDALGRVAPVGAIGDAVREQCAAAGAYVACPTVADTVRVWRVGQPPGHGG